MALNLTFQPSGNTNAIIYARSPIIYKFEGCDASQYTYTISVLATTGLTNTLSEYIQINRTPDLDNVIIINIGNIIKNYINSNFSKTTENAVYIQISCIEYDGTNINSTVTSDICIASYGYSNYLDGINKNDKKDLYYPLSSTPDIIYLPQYGDTGNTYSIAWSNDIFNPFTSLYYKIYYYSGGTYKHETEYTRVADLPYRYITPIYCGYIDLKLSYNIDVDYNTDMLLEVGYLIYNNPNVILKEYIIKPDLCNENNLHKLKFINKFGAWETIFIKGQIEETTSIEFEIYKYSKINKVNMTYSPDGSYHKFFTNGKSSIKLNTGWLLDNMNQVLDELMLSEHVFYDDKPCIITDKSLTYKSNKYQSLINYVITIELSYDKINNIQ
jgi:hypothetical protein